MKAITKETIREIITEARVDEVVQMATSLTTKGKNQIGSCPFCHKPDGFVVSQSKNIYRCYECGAAGDAIRFVMEWAGMDYTQALQYIGGMNDIEIKYNN